MKGLYKVQYFDTGVLDTSGTPWLANISSNIRKEIEMCFWHYHGLGPKKPEAKNLVTLSL
jgi:hypothetical protein